MLKLKIVIVRCHDEQDEIKVQVVVVSGGAGGIGSAIVDRFLSDGSRVAIVDRNQERAIQLINDYWPHYAEQDLV
jgi:NAD(P)-dependent dehydrogenase (short-subunit alcohol dehydrogenase family)